jgi:hypothetical protein
MARIGSREIAGYYPTPPRIVPMIAAMLALKDDSRELIACDPCAGEGAAGVELVRAVSKDAKLYTCELEAGRHSKLQVNARALGWHSQQHALLGDAFRVDFGKGGWCGLLYLNPPYDHDHEHGRLEQRFLARFDAVLSEGGVLVFVVPLQALAASAQFIAARYGDVACFRFPDPEFATFKQCVVVARKSEIRTRPKTLNNLRGWANGTISPPVLGSVDARWSIARGWSTTIWQLRPVDVVQLATRARLWHQTGKAGRLELIPGVLPDLPAGDLMLRKFPVLTEPRPAHISSALASGLFNGRRVTATEKGLPPLLVKGNFERELVTVEERSDEDREVTTMVQQPRLVVVALDLATGKYHEVKAGGRSESSAVSDMTLEDLLHHYGPSLLEVMHDQCPPVYLPARDAQNVPLAAVARPLFEAQAHAARAVIMALGGPGKRLSQRRRGQVMLLGEIGCGKTSVAITAAVTMGARRPLVVCPPHLLQSWTNELAAVLPDAGVTILSDLGDVDRFAADDSPGVVVGVLSRESAKLGHAQHSAGGTCSRCGAVTPDEDHAKKRSRCAHQSVSPANEAARVATALALELFPYCPNDEHVQALFPGRHMRRSAESGKRKSASLFAGVSRPVLDRAVKVACEVPPSGHYQQTDPTFRLLAHVLIAARDATWIARAVEWFAAANDWQRSEWARDLALLLPADLREAAYTKAWSSYTYSYGRQTASTAFADVMGRAAAGMDSRAGNIKIGPDGVSLDGLAPGSLKQARKLLRQLCTVARFENGPVCDEPLYQATPEPRRYPLARYIARRHPSLYDLLIVDEAHEYAGEDSAQTHAVERLVELGAPVIRLTGSVMNGYAESLFTPWLSMSPGFREEFGRDESTRFIDRYGYRKVVVTERSPSESEIERGAQSDRIIRTERKSGSTPGVLPLFLFRHLLPYSVTLHKADLKQDLPPCTHHRHDIEPSPELLRSYKHLENRLAQQIRADLFQTGLAGKLFGQLSELPSYLDRATADVGNQPDGHYRICYPAKCGGGLVAEGACFPESELLPKERWLVDLLRNELDEGRNVMVLGWHVELLPRLVRVIERELGIKAPLLRPEKVPTRKRQEWIEREVVRKGRRVLVANPIAIQTGLNNLVHFSSQAWMENPACNPIALRQTVGRVDRIGQKLETRIHFPVYANTLQEKLYTLLMRKVAVSTATDGLDAESVLLASGGGQDGALLGLSVGRQLWAILQEAANRVAA